jgi:hypothetical protein
MTYGKSIFCYISPHLIGLPNSGSLRTSNSCIMSWQARPSQTNSKTLWMHGQTKSVNHGESGSSLMPSSIFEHSLTPGNLTPSDPKSLRSSTSSSQSASFTPLLNLTLSSPPRSSTRMRPKRRLKPVMKMPALTSTISARGLISRWRGQRRCSLQAPGL